MNNELRFGVNYVPSHGWWYSWVDWDESHILGDLVAISALGCDHIRIHCLWPLFQPNSNLVSELMLSRLESLLNHARTTGLDVIVTVLNGWLSGMDFRPAWLDDKANIFVDPDVIMAERDLISAIAGRVGTHSQFLGFDVGNEPNVLSTGVKNVTTRGQGDRWVTEMLAHCDLVAPGKLHSVGMDHMPWLTDLTPFSRAAIARAGAVTPVHAWMLFAGALARYGESGTGSIQLAVYMLELAKAFHEDSVRQVWLQECGVSAQWLKDTTPEDFVTEVLGSLANVENLWGITWWCSHDIERRLSGFADLEYDLGLLTVRNGVKPEGEKFRQMVQVIKSGVLPRATRHIALVLPTGLTPDLKFADAYFRLVEQGISPAIVLESKVSDDAHLKARGILTLIAFRAESPASDTPMRVMSEQWTAPNSDGT